MFLVIVEAFAETASFRIPETHTFHKTLPLPPYTSCIGLLGAALGQSMQDAQAYVENNGIAIGAAGRDRGEFKDLWKYRKVKSGETISDVLIREYRVDLSFIVVFGAATEETARGLAQAFRDPMYALTAGHSDSLMFIRSVEVTEHREPEGLQALRFCVVPADLSGQYEPDRSIFELPITETVKAPLVAHLPVRFAFDGHQRTVAAREPFTFVGHPVQLKTPVQGYQIENETVVLR